MSLARGQEQCIEEPALDPIAGIPLDPDLPRDLIRDLKTHSGDILRHLIWILPQHLIEILSILLIDLRSQIQ